MTTAIRRFESFICPFATGHGASAARRARGSLPDKRPHRPRGEVNVGRMVFVKRRIRVAIAASADAHCERCRRTPGRRVERPRARLARPFARIRPNDRTSRLTGRRCRFCGRPSVSCRPLRTRQRRASQAVRCPIRRLAAACARERRRSGVAGNEGIACIQR